MADRDPIAQALEDLRKKEAAEPKAPDPDELVPFHDSMVPRAEAECLESLERALVGTDVSYKVKDGHITEINLDNSPVTAVLLRGVRLPSRLKLLSLSGCSNISSLFGIWFPDTLKELDLNFTRILHLEDASLPDGLEVLHLGGSSILGSILKDVQFPDALKELTFWECPDVTYLSSAVTLPPNLELLDFDESGLEDIEEGVVFPASLRLLGVAKTAFTSSGPKFEKFAKALSVSNPKCVLRV
jgi:Leucine-rich repeat (LRR) protein